jgi:peroxiredoxin Q/BCP
MREFRVHHDELTRNGLAVVGISRNPPELNHKWATRLKLPYPMLSDPDGDAGAAFGVIRRIGIAGWNIELYRRATFLADIHGRVIAVWREVKIRGHAKQVLEVAQALQRPLD